MNCHDALTTQAATQTAKFLTDYNWMLKDRSSDWPIDLDAHYAICQESNENTTLCHQVTGDVILFAPDHSYSHIEILDDCPPYSLYRIPAAATFVDWVEEIARQWLLTGNLPT